MRGWERGEEERLPPGYRVDTTDAAIEALKPAPIVDGRLQGTGGASGATGYLIREASRFLFGLLSNARRRDA